jgi:hypothetical protein
VKQILFHVTSLYLFFFYIFILQTLVFLGLVNKLGKDSKEAFFLNFSQPHFVYQTKELYVYIYITGTKLLFATSDGLVYTADGYLTSQ